MKLSGSHSAEAQIAHERRLAVRALLMRPMMRASVDPEVFGFVRNHASWLRDWFGRHLGWSLQVDAEIARLGKTPSEPVDSTRPARDPVHGISFTRARYVLFCLALAYLERSERQTTLGNIAKELVAVTAEEPHFENCGIHFDLSVRDCRKDLVHVIHLLIDLGVVVRVHGEESQYVAESGDVLYSVHRPAISAMMNVRRGPSLVQCQDLPGRIAAMLEEVRPDTEEGWNRYLRTRLMRRLVDDPVLYYEVLDSDEKNYLDSQRPFLLKILAEGTGLVPEVRAEGIALVDEEGDLTDLGIPSEGTESHFALLLAEHLALRLRENPRTPVGLGELKAKARELISQFGRYWRKDAREPGAEAGLLTEALSRLEALGLARVLPEEAVLPLPAISRYSIDSPPLSQEEFS